jgi:hypothetical protein
MPIFTDFDLIIGFVLLMLAAGTVVATGTQLAARLTRMRARFLRQAIEELLAQIAPRHLSPDDARQLALILLRHPWLAGRTNDCADALRREDFVRLLIEVAAGSSPVAARLRDAFGLTTAAQAVELSETIGSHALRLEMECPGESARDRDIKAIIAAVGPHPLVARIHGWYGHAMNRATRRYMRQARLVTAALALALVLALRLDLLGFFRLPTSTHWPGMALSWLLISLGTPFWYDRLKDLLHFRPSIM